jgi:hypothetical protein
VVTAPPAAETRPRAILVLDGEDGRRPSIAASSRRTVASLLGAAPLRPVEAMRLLHCAVLLRGALVRAPRSSTAQ